MKRQKIVGVGTLLAVIVLCFFAFGNWLAGQDEPQQLAWKEQYQQSLWTPLQQRGLTLADVGRALGEGSLWMISADGEPRLVSRHTVESDDRQWRAQAVIALDSQQMESLVEAQAWQPGSPDQSVNPAISTTLAGYPVERISMIPHQPLELRYIQGTFGPVEVRMPVNQGEVWIYAREGVVVAVSDEQAHSIMFGLHDEF
ncbi:hypothetical protein SAMN05216198_3227 [Halopseudomonas litoralis]|uniref:Uncharacterized protein n=1 Tax=Halopseudomonas litoralis TaxID=797277 RepID=A0A1H1WEC7_9GAMM|nr:hypothetical protein [Halopseudomonas litoralis]SDS94716.1 hypothetical protein SAMN05216198_3227 [Halopseudomonas litoralis]